MTVDEALYTLLQSYTSITNEVGDGVYPVIRSQKSSLPAITYRKVSSPRVYDFDGVAMIEQNIDLHIYAKTYGKLQELVQLLEDALSGASGTFAGTEIEYVTVLEVGNDDFLEDEEIYTDTMEIKIRFKG